MQSKAKLCLRCSTHSGYKSSIKIIHIIARDTDIAYTFAGVRTAFWSAYKLRSSKHRKHETDLDTVDIYAYIRIYIYKDPAKAA